MTDLVLPWPPSVNHYWRSIVIKGASRTLLSAEGREYRDTVARVVRRLEVGVGLQSRLDIAIAVVEPDRRKRDLDNLLKGPLDAMKHAGVFVDDSQFDRIVIERAGLAADGVGLLHVTIDERVDAQVSLPLSAAAPMLITKPASVDGRPLPF